MEHLNRLAQLRQEIIQTANKYGLHLQKDTPITIEQSYEIIHRMDKIIEATSR